MRSLHHSYRKTRELYVRGRKQLYIKKRCTLQLALEELTINWDTLEASSYSCSLSWPAYTNFQYGNPQSDRALIFQIGCRTSAYRHFSISHKSVHSNQLHYNGSYCIVRWLVIHFFLITLLDLWTTYPLQTKKEVYTTVMPSGLLALHQPWAFLPSQVLWSLTLVGSRAYGPHYSFLFKLSRTENPSCAALNRSGSSCLCPNRTLTPKTWTIVWAYFS